jgi:hypothetical protein
MNNSIVVHPRPEYGALALDFSSDLFKYHIVGIKTGLLRREAQHVFGRISISAAEAAWYFYHPARVAKAVADWERRWAEAGRPRDPSEYDDYTFFPCREMSVIIGGCEPVELSSRFFADAAHTVFTHDLQRRGCEGGPSFPRLLRSALNIFRDIADNGRGCVSQDTIGRVCNGLTRMYYHSAGSKNPIAQYRHTILSAKMSLGVFWKNILTLGPSFPWFHLLQILEEYERVCGSYVPLHRTITPGDFASIIQMLLGVDGNFKPTCRIAEDTALLAS